MGRVCWHNFNFWQEEDSYYRHEREVATNRNNSERLFAQRVKLLR